MTTDCIFCKIIAGKIPAKKIKENEHVLVIEDIAPKAPVHYLVIPKVHVKNICELSDEHERVCWEIMKMGRDLCEQITGGAGFNFISNNGASAGQTVMHMHWHFIAGKKLREIAREAEL